MRKRRMRKRKICSRVPSVLLCVIVSLFFTACYPTGYREKMEMNQQEEEISIEELNSSDNEIISYDFDTNMDVPEECGVYSVEYRPWDEEKVRRVFFGSDDKGIYSYEVHSKSEYVEGIDEKCRHVYELKDGRCVCCDAGQLDYNTRVGWDIYSMYPSCFQNFYGNEERLRSLLPEEELQSFSVDDSKKRMEEIIAGLELPAALDRVQVYAIDSAARDWMEQEYGGDYKNAQDAYMLIYPVRIEDVYAAPIYRQWDNSLETDARGSYIIAVFTEEKLEYFEFCNPISNGTLLRKEKIYSKIQAIKIVKQHMDSISFTNDKSCQISGGVLQYLYLKRPADMTGKFEMKPFWVFFQIKQKPDGLEFSHSLFVDAVTGQVFD